MRNTAPRTPAEMTLNQVLAHKGFTSRQVPRTREKEILKEGKVVFTGDSAAVWAWIRAQL